jgi:hypothetical protein
MNAPVRAGSPPDLSRPSVFWAALGRWIAKNGPEAVKSAIIGAAIGYILNFGLAYFVFRGHANFDGASGIFGSALHSSLFTGIISLVFFGLLGYRRSVGKERFWRDIRNIPATIGRLLRADGRAARVHLLWGAAASFAAMQLVSPWLGAAVAVGFLSTVPTVIGRVLSGLASRAFSSALGMVSPTRGKKLESPVGMAVGLLGSAAALLCGHNRHRWLCQAGPGDWLRHGGMGARPRDPEDQYAGRLSFAGVSSLCRSDRQSHPPLARTCPRSTRPRGDGRTVGRRRRHGRPCCIDASGCFDVWRRRWGFLRSSRHCGRLPSRFNARRRLGRRQYGLAV